MDAAQCKEHHSTCPQFVWDATTVDIHHDAKVPNTWWAAEDMQPCVHNHLQFHNMSKETNLTSAKGPQNQMGTLWDTSVFLSAIPRPNSSVQPSNNSLAGALAVSLLHVGSSRSYVNCFQICETNASFTPSHIDVMPPWFALVGDQTPTGLGIWMQHSARSITQLARSPFRTPTLWTYTMMPRCPTHGGLLRIRSHASTICKLRNMSKETNLTSATGPHNQMGTP